jgi:S1-C subfamily serine protease
MVADETVGTRAAPRTPAPPAERDGGTGSRRAKHRREPETPQPRPSSRRSRRRDRRRGRDRPKILPRTALGLSVLLLAMGIAAGFTGAVLYAYYEYRLGQTEDEVADFQANFTDRIDAAVESIEEEREGAVTEIRAQLEELQQFAAAGETLGTLVTSAEPSVWFVSTLDEDGGAAVGSAFVAFSDPSESFLITSYTTVRAATVEPAPEIRLRKGDDEIIAALTRWDPDNDLALLSVQRGGLPALSWAPTEPPVAIGDRVFAVSGLGGAGASITQGFVAGVSVEGVQHGAPIGPAFQGGPLLNSRGEVVAVASRTYAPLNFVTDTVLFGVPVRNACVEVVQCPDEETAPGGEADVPPEGDLPEGEAEIPEGEIPEGEAGPVEEP